MSEKYRSTIAAYLLVVMSSHGNSSLILTLQTTYLVELAGQNDAVLARYCQEGNQIVLFIHASLRTVYQIVALIKS